MLLYLPSKQPPQYPEEIYFSNYTIHQLGEFSSNVHAEVVYMQVLANKSSVLIEAIS